MTYGSKNRDIIKNTKIVLPAKIKLYAMIIDNERIANALYFSLYGEKSTAKITARGKQANAA